MIAASKETINFKNIAYGHTLDLLFYSLTPDGPPQKGFFKNSLEELRGVCTEHREWRGGKNLFLGLLISGVSGVVSRGEEGATIAMGQNG